MDSSPCLTSSTPERIDCVRTGHHSAYGGTHIKFLKRSFEHVAEQGSLRLCQTVLDSTDIRALAEFYRLLLGLVYRPGDEPPAAGEPDDRAQDWLVLRTPETTPQLAFQYVEQLTPPTWPQSDIPQQLHLDLSVSSIEELELQHERVLALGGRPLGDNKDAGDDEPFRVYADPAGHPFCIFVAQQS